MRQHRKYKLKKITGYPTLIAVLGKASLESRVTTTIPKNESKSKKGFTMALCKNKRKNNC